MLLLDQGRQILLSLGAAFYVIFVNLVRTKKTCSPKAYGTKNGRLTPSTLLFYSKNICPGKVRGTRKGGEGQLHKLIWKSVGPLLVFLFVFTEKKSVNQKGKGKFTCDSAGWL